MKARFGVLMVVLLGLFYLTVPVIAYHVFDTEYGESKKVSLTGVLMNVS